MRIAMASDHAGYDLKAMLVPWMKMEGHQVSDLGTNSDSPVDYPDFAEAAALAVVRGEADRAIVICGSGVGATVAANKVPGIRACMCHDTYSAHQGVEHDDINILVLGARIIGIELAKELVRAWIEARFSAEERHVRRVGKIRKIEEKFGERMALEKGAAR